MGAESKRTAFEVYKEEGADPVVEQLVILGDQLQRDDALPSVEGIVYDPKTQETRPFSFNRLSGRTIFSFVNELGTPDCQTQTGNIELMAYDHPELAVYTVSKQSPDQLREKATEEGISHQLISIDHDTAVALGVALTPDSGPDGEELALGEFWNNALCRSLVVAGIDNLVEGMNARIYHIEQLTDQAKQPNIEAAVLVANAQ